MMKVWNVWLVFSTFLLCIMGTFLTRSGVVSSVHAFANSQIGPWFVGFMAVVLLVCSGANLKNRDYLKSENRLDSMVETHEFFSSPLTFPTTFVQVFAPSRVIWTLPSSVPTQMIWPFLGDSEIE